MRGLLKQREALASGLCAVMRVMRSYFDCPSPEAALHPGSVALPDLAKSIDFCDGS